MRPAHVLPTLQETLMCIYFHRQFPFTFKCTFPCLRVCPSPKGGMRTSRKPPLCFSHQTLLNVRYLQSHKNGRRVEGWSHVYLQHINCLDITGEDRRQRGQVNWSRGFSHAVISLISSPSIPTLISSPSIQILTVLMISRIAGHHRKKNTQLASALLFSI